MFQILCNESGVQFCFFSLLEGAVLRKDTGVVAYSWNHSRDLAVSQNEGDPSTDPRILALGFHVYK